MKRKERTWVICTEIENPTFGYFMNWTLASSKFMVHTDPLIHGWQRRCYPLCIDDIAVGTVVVGVVAIVVVVVAETFWMYCSQIFWMYFLVGLVVCVIVVEVVVDVTANCVVIMGVVVPKRFSESSIKMSENGMKYLENRAVCHTVSTSWFETTL